MLDFKTIYNTFWPRIAYYANKFVNNREEAKDIAQDIFATLYQHLEKIPNEDAACVYLYTCAKHRCLNHKKVTQKEHQRQPDYLYFLETDPEIVDTEFTAKMLACMEALPTERLKVFKLLFFDGLKLQQVADKLRLSISTIKSQRDKGLITLRKDLA